MSEDKTGDRIPRDMLFSCYVGMRVIKEAYGPRNHGDTGPPVVKGEVVEYNPDDLENDPTIKIAYEGGSTEYMTLLEVVPNCPTLLAICLGSEVPFYVDLRDLSILQESELLERCLRALDPENPPNKNNILDRREEWSGATIPGLQMACKYLAPENRDKPIRADWLHWFIEWFTRLESPRLLAKCDEQKLRVLKTEVFSGDEMLNEAEFLAQHDLPQCFKFCTEGICKAISRPDEITGMMTVRHVSRVVRMMKNHPKLRRALWPSFVHHLPPGIQQRPAPEILLNDSTLAYWVHQSMDFHFQKSKAVAVIEQASNDALKRQLSADDICGKMFPPQWQQL
jgi:hypothetical protein